MKLSVFSVLICILLAISMAACATSTATSSPTTTASNSTNQTNVATKVIKWKTQSTSPMVPPDPKEGWNMGVMEEKFNEWITDMSGGMVEVELMQPSTVVPPMQHFTAVKDGVLEMAMAFPPYDEGILGGITNIASGVRGLYTKPEQVFDLFQKYGLADLLREIYAEHNIYYIPGLWAADYSIITKFPINSLDDLKGKKIRAAGGEAKFIEKIGGVPVTTIATGDMYMALQLGTIDGAVFGGGTALEYKLNEVAPYFLSEPTGFVQAAFYVNMDALEALPPDIQYNFKKYADEMAFVLSMSDIGRKNMRYAKMEAAGFTMNALSKEDTLKFQNYYMAVLDDMKVQAEAKGDTNYIKAYEMVQQQLKDWGNNR